MSELDERFWSKVNKGGASECWPWTGHRNAQGYGTYRLDGTMQRAARLVSGARSGQVVRHKCDNPSCVNPAHLTTGSQKQNVADCASRGRRADARGEENNFAKLNDAQVNSLRARFDAIATYASGRKAYGEVQRLADDYGITDANLYQIVNRRTWRHV